MGIARVIVLFCLGFGLVSRTELRAEEHPPVDHSTASEVTRAANESSASLLPNDQSSAVQSTFATHLDRLSTAIDNSRKARLSRLRAALKQPTDTQYLSTITAIDPTTTQEEAYQLRGIVDTIVTGTASTFTGSGLATVNLKLNQTESVWRSDDIRNGFDKAKPFFDIAGNALVGASLIFTAKNKPTTGLTAANGSTAITGVATLAIGSLLQHYFGSHQSQLGTVSDAIDRANADMAQLAFSRMAYDEIQTRYDLANKYYLAAGAQTKTLRQLLDRIDDLYAHPTSFSKDQKIKLIDDVSAARTQYESIANFVDTYTDQLLTSYDKYLQDKNLEPIWPQLTDAKTAISTFKQNYKANITDNFLDKFPTYAGVLVDLRTEVGQE